MRNHLRRGMVLIKKSVLLGCVIGGILLLCSADLLAQDAASSDQETKELIKLKRRLPMLNGHNFIPTTNITQVPFITTYFRNTTGLANAFGFDIPIYDPEGEVIYQVDANITYMMLDLAYQQAVTDWLAFSIQGAGVGRVGTNAESILAQGISALASIQLGGIARIWHNDSAVLSAAASLRQNKLIGVDIIGFAQSIVDTGIIDTSNLFGTIPSTRWKGGLRFAYAPNDLWGVLAFVDFGSGDSLAGEEEKDTVFEFGGLASLDLNTRTKLPIGFALGYRYTNYPESSGDLIESAGLTTLRIAYTGRREFSIGLEAGYTAAPVVDTEQSLKFGSLMFNIQYFF
jgi:hypothetical protein